MTATRTLDQMYTVYDDTDLHPLNFSGDKHIHCLVDGTALT
jgi:hypothetical protein